MERPSVRSIVFIPFPFSNLKDVKMRLALVLISPIGEDVLLVQIIEKLQKIKKRISEYVLSP